MSGLTLLGFVGIDETVRTRVTKNYFGFILERSSAGKARENASDQVAIGFSFASDWLKKWREISRPTTELSNAKPMQSRITFDTQLKITLIWLNLYYSKM